MRTIKQTNKKVTSSLQPSSPVVVYTWGIWLVLVNNHISLTLSVNHLRFGQLFHSVYSNSETPMTHELKAAEEEYWWISFLSHSTATVSCGSVCAGLDFAYECSSTLSNLISLPCNQIHPATGDPNNLVNLKVFLQIYWPSRVKQSKCWSTPHRYFFNYWTGISGA